MIADKYISVMLIDAVLRILVTRPTLVEGTVRWGHLTGKWVKPKLNTGLAFNRYIITLKTNIGTKNNNGE